MSDPITDELPVVEQTPAEKLTSDTKRGAYIIGAIVVLALLVSVILVITALTGGGDSGPQTSGDLTEIQTNEERIAEADINLEDIVEDPSPDLLQSLLDTDFFAESGFSDQVVDRLNEQAQQQLDALGENVPDVNVDIPTDLPDIELPDIDAEIDLGEADLGGLEAQTQELLDQADLETVDDVRGALESLLG